MAIASGEGDSRGCRHGPAIRTWYSLSTTDDVVLMEAGRRLCGTSLCGATPCGRSRPTNSFGSRSEGLHHDERARTGFMVASGGVYPRNMGMTGLAPAWAMARRRPMQYRCKVDTATRCSGVCPHTWSDLTWPSLMYCCQQHTVSHKNKVWSDGKTCQSAGHPK